MTETAIKELEKRLNDFTTRLECLEKNLESSTLSNVGSVKQQQQQQQKPEEENKTGKVVGGEENDSIKAYEGLIHQFIDVYVQFSCQTEDVDIAKQASLVLAAVTAQKEFLKLAVRYKKPSDLQLAELLQSTSEAISEVVTVLRNVKNKQHPTFNHLSSIAEGINALAWVTISPSPASFIDEMRASSQFYSNRILADSKINPDGHLYLSWVQSFSGFLIELKSYVRQYHTTGVSWNNKGQDISVLLPSSTISSSSTASTATEEFTSKKRTPFRVNKPPATKTPKLQLDGDKWIAEWQKGNKNMKIVADSSRQTVNIYKCEDCVIHIQGKVNRISVNGCKKIAVVFENVISSVNFVDCQSVEMQALGRIPMIIIDKTDGCQVFLSKDSIEVEIITAKISEMNVHIPPLAVGQGEDYVERPVVEQFKTVIKGTNLVTTPVQHLG